jgi:Protein-L-isoaspartate(D-aspartate) O-methyltransferase (PCMT)
METVITTTTPDPVQLRATMVGSLAAGGHLRTPEIMTAFTETERHLFLPAAGLAAAYDNDAVPVKHDSDGEMISCISAPSIVATQLEQLGVHLGDKVLEAGAATGYNAALLARLAGPAGHVWSIDGTLAYLTVREGDDDAGRFWEIGAVGHGTRAAALNRNVADAIREWDRDYGNQAPAPGLRMAPAAHRGLLTAPDPRFIIDKPASRLVTDWRR